MHGAGKGEGGIGGHGDGGIGGHGDGGGGQELGASIFVLLNSFIFLA